MQVCVDGFLSILEQDLKLATDQVDTPGNVIWGPDTLEFWDAISKKWISLLVTVPGK